MVKLYLNAYKEFLKNNPNSAAARNHETAEEGLVHDIFYPGSKEWSIVSGGLFGKPDFKGFLENYFNITL